MSTKWPYLEIVFGIMFTLEAITRVVVARNYASHFLDPMTLLDWLSVLPFFIEVYIYIYIIYIYKYISCCS